MVGGTGGEMNGGKNELHLCGGGLWHTLHYTKCMAGVLFSYHLKLTTQYKQLPYWLSKTPNRNVLQNMSHKECQIKPANYLQITFYQ